MAATLAPPSRLDELDARIRALLELEDTAAPDLLGALRRDRQAAEAELARLLEAIG
jgi:hypothetical protein